MSDSWSLALCPANRESSVASLLTRWQFENVLFRIRCRSVHRGRVIDRFRPAFPRYLFCKPRGYFHTLRTRIAGLDFVRDGQIVATVPDLAIRSLLEVAAENYVLPTPETASAKFKSGDRVLIRGASMLAGYSATFQHSIDATRAVVLINWLGRMCPASIDERDLVAEVVASNEPTYAPRRKRRRRRKGQHRSSTTTPA